MYKFTTMSGRGISVVSESQLAYMGGFFDGEGCIGIYMRQTWVPQVTVAQYDTKPLELFAQIIQPTSKNKATSGVSSYVWYSLGTIPIIRAIYPHLIVKKEEAELLLRWAEITEQYHKGQHFSIEHKVEIGELATGLRQIKQDRRDRNKRGI